MMHIAHANPSHPSNRGPNTTELRMDNVCCSAHGLSLMITATKGDVKHTILFDTGPEESAWERNVSRLRPDLSKIELVSSPPFFQTTRQLPLASFPTEVMLCTAFRVAPGSPMLFRLITHHSNSAHALKTLSRSNSPTGTVTTPAVC